MQPRAGFSRGPRGHGLCSKSQRKILRGGGQHSSSKTGVLSRLQEEGSRRFNGNAAGNLLEGDLLITDRQRPSRNRSHQGKKNTHSFRCRRGSGRSKGRKPPGKKRGTESQTGKSRRS